MKHFEVKYEDRVLMRTYVVTVKAATPESAERKVLKDRPYVKIVETQEVPNGQEVNR